MEMFTNNNGKWKIEDGKLTEYYEGKEEITEYLEDLIA